MGNNVLSIIKEKNCLCFVFSPISSWELETSLNPGGPVKIMKKKTLGGTQGLSSSTTPCHFLPTPAAFLLSRNKPFSHDSRRVNS
jgi:hypothetical protein